MHGRPVGPHKSLCRPHRGRLLPCWALRKGILQVQRSLGNSAGLWSQLTCTHGARAAQGPLAQGDRRPGGQ